MSEPGSRGPAGDTPGEPRSSGGGDVPGDRDDVPGGGGGAAPGGATISGVVLAVDPASVEAPFRQLRQQIVAAVTTGSLSPGTRLPAVRALAEQVGVASATAAKVYRELESTGVLETRGRSGTFIAEQNLRSAILLRAAEEFAERAASAGFSADDAADAVRDAYTRLD